MLKVHISTQHFKIPDLNNGVASVRIHWGIFRRPTTVVGVSRDTPGMYGQNLKKIDEKDAKKRRKKKTQKKDTKKDAKKKTQKKMQKKDADLSLSFNPTSISEP